MAFLCDIADMDSVFPSEIWTAIRLSLRPTDDIVSTLNEERRASPEVQELIQAILFSRRFVATYLTALAALIAVWAISKWLSNFFTRRTAVTSPPSIASSSSSTLQGTESPPLKDVSAESTPLLEGLNRNGRSVHVRTWHRIRAFMLHQPKPIPALTAPKNTLPANETSLIIFLFLTLNIFYLFYGLPLSSKHVFTFADRAGLLFVVNLPVLYILAAKNNQPLGWITGWSYEGLNIFHRRLGEWLTVTAVIHAICMVIGFYQLLAPSGFSLYWYLTRFIIIFGQIGFASYIVIYFTSIGYFRQASYELFLASHIFLQVLALVMLFFHHHNARPYVGAALAIWVLDRGISRIALKTSPFTATLEIAKDGETVLVFCDMPLARSRWNFGMKSGWLAGQHVFLTVPEISGRHRFQAHPFTIASPAPPRDTNAKSWPLQLTIRAQDGFSRELLEYAKLHQHSRVLIDGPYSSSEVLHAVQKADRTCLIAGGSGIAVTYPFAWALQAGSLLASDVIHDRIFYLNGQRRSPNVSRIDLVDQKKFAHFWIRQESVHESWIKLLPDATESASFKHATGNPTNTGKALDLITHRFETRSATGEHQRPDMAAELKAWVWTDQKEELNSHDRICVVVSGPDGLVRDIQNTVAELVQDGCNIEVHVEKFGW